MAGAIFVASSPRPNSPFSPACGLIAQTPDLWIGEAGAHQHLVPAGYDPFDQAGLNLVDGIQHSRYAW